MLTVTQRKRSTCFVKSYCSCSSCRSLFWTFWCSSDLCGEAGRVLDGSSTLDGRTDVGRRRCEGDGGSTPAPRGRTHQTPYTVVQINLGDQ